MKFEEYYNNEKIKIINKLTLENILKEKQGLLTAVEDKNINSPYILKVKKIISKRGIEGKLSSIINKILEEDNIFANLFYGKLRISPNISNNIILNYLKQNGILIDSNSSPSIKPFKHSLKYLGKLNGKEIYYYLSDKGQPFTHNETLPRVKLINNVNNIYKNSIVIFDHTIPNNTDPSPITNHSIFTIKKLIDENSSNSNMRF